MSMRRVLPSYLGLWHSGAQSSLFASLSWTQLIAREHGLDIGWCII